MMRHTQNDVLLLLVQCYLSKFLSYMDIVYSWVFLFYHKKYKVLSKWQLQPSNYVAVTWGMFTWQLIL